MQQSGSFSFMKVSIEEKFNCDMNNDNYDGARLDHPDVFLKKHCCRPDATVTQPNENKS
jgi:hypothetical protein